MEKGIDKAAERALEAYPSTPHWDERITCMYRGGFIRGYQQAEKDLELTWEDIGWIIEEAIDNTPDDLVEKEQICQEVLKRFKERKNNEIQDKVQRPYQQVKAICQ